MKTIRIATRKSPLALWQAEQVKTQLEEAGLTAELCPIDTKGDKILNTTISKIGSKGVFTEELEALLEKGDVDIAVHSAKDLASELPEGFDVISVGERTAVTDVLVAESAVDPEQPLRIGTSSTRRVAQLSRQFPNLQITAIRGNLQTRLEKLKNGDCDALMLAKAGVIRMGFSHLIQHEFSTDQIPPAAGQGSIAIEAYQTIHPTIRKLIKAATNNNEAFTCIAAERSFLKTLEGGCSIPVFAHATTLDGSQISLTGGILSLDGTEEIKREAMGLSPTELGEYLANEVLENGGDKILQEIKNQLGYL